MDFYVVFLKIEWVPTFYGEIKKKKKISQTSEDWQIIYSIDAG